MWNAEKAAMEVEWGNIFSFERRRNLNIIIMLFYFHHISFIFIKGVFADDEWC
jgi:hypothetical protein